MSRALRLGSIAAVALSVLLYLFVSCMSAPPNPYDPSNTKIYLILESSSGQVSIDTITDSIGNTIKVGITANLPSYVDSIGLKFYSAEGNVEIDTILTNLFLLKNNDTLWYKTSFAAKDKSTLVATVFAGQNKNITYGYFNIFNKPVPHTWPHLVISGLKSITAAQTCSLSVSVNDSNAAQLYSFYVKKDTLPFTAFTPPFKWTPPTGFSGAHQVLFKVTDTDSPAYFDTQTVTITLSALIDTHPKLPHWNNDSVNLNEAEGSTISLTLSDISTGDSLSFILMPGLPAKDTIINTVYSYTFAAFDTNNYYPKIIVKDKKGNADTMTLHLWARRTNIVDTIGPRITKISGPATNTRTTNPNDTLVYAITDQSGVDTVSWTLNSSAPTALLPDANDRYTIIAILSVYRANRIIISATDKSSVHNKSADTTILDYNVAPKSIDQNLSTRKNTSLSITLTADPIDGDTLSSWSVVTPPVNGALSGTAPSLIYTPQTGFLGSDSLTFTVSDGKNTSNIAKVKINVSDILVAPVASKIIADASVNKGLPVSFVATVNSNSNPSPIFKWFKEGLADSVSANQTFTISKTVYLDQGRYRYFVMNSQGKDSSNWITLTVKDVTKPVIVLKGGTPQQIPVGGVYTELGDSAYDDKDGIITSKVVIDTLKVKASQIGSYPVTYAVKDSAGNIADTVTRSVQVYGAAPTVAKISGNKETCINVAAVFSVMATGTRPLKYQWMKGTAAAPGAAIDSIYQITPISTADAGSFYCIVSNGISPDAQSQAMTLTVDNPPAISSITASPATMPICQGTQIAFTATATGTAPLTYSWKKNGTAIASAANSATYTINAVAASDSGQYSCTVSNGCVPATTSSSIQLKTTTLPVFSFPPKDTTFKKWAGDSITLTVAASGAGALSYQWYKGTTPLGVASASPTKLINPIALADTGTYTCAVSNGCNPVISKAIILKAKVVAKVAAGDGHSLILMTDGTLWACGENGNGELGVGSVNQIAPVLVTTSVKNISAGSGGNNSFILKTDGTLWGCGYNGFGQLGDSSTTDRSTPVQITTGVQSIAAGGLHSLILKTDGTLWTSGYNGVGQLGDGTSNDHLKPIQVWTGVKAIAAGANHSLILQNDGILFGCGFNILGELGDGSKTNQPSLVQIKTGIQSISAGFEHSLILQTDGTLWGCGTNSNGQLGDNTVIDKYTPVQIMLDVQSMAGGNNYSLIIKKDGTLWACGANDYGQLGDGTIIERHAPVQIKF